MTSTDRIDIAGGYYIAPCPEMDAWAIYRSDGSHDGPYWAGERAEERARAFASAINGRIAELQKVAAERSQAQSNSPDDGWRPVRARGEAGCTYIDFWYEKVSKIVVVANRIDKKSFSFALPPPPAKETERG